MDNVHNLVDKLGYFCLEASLTTKKRPDRPFKGHTYAPKLGIRLCITRNVILKHIYEFFEFFLIGCFMLQAEPPIR